MFFVKWRHSNPPPSGAWCQMASSFEPGSVFISLFFHFPQPRLTLNNYSEIHCRDSDLKWRLLQMDQPAGSRPHLHHPNGPFNKWTGVICFEIISRTAILPLKMGKKRFISNRQNQAQIAKTNQHPDGSGYITWLYLYIIEASFVHICEIFIFSFATQHT